VSALLVGMPLLTLTAGASPGGWIPSTGSSPSISISVDIFVKKLVKVLLLLPTQFFTLVSFTPAKNY
jgi:hypothetical protein